MVEKNIRIIKNPKVQDLCLAVEIVISILAFKFLAGGTGVDFDEAFSWDIVVNNGMGGILFATASDVHPPLYYLIVKAFFSLFGESLKVMVWVSIVPVLFGMILSATFIKKEWGFASAFLFNIAFAFAPFILHYNLNLRMYSWMDFFILGVTLVGYELVKDNRLTWWHYILLFTFSILAVYTQYFAVIPIVVCYAWIFICLIIKKETHKLISFFIVGILDVVFYLPWLLFGMSNMGIGSGGTSENYKYLLRPTEIFEELFATNLKNSELMAMILVALAILVFIILKERYSKIEKTFMWMLIFNAIFCWYFSQWLGSLNGHFFASRYVIFCLMFIWLFLSVVYSRCNAGVYVLFGLWSVELCLSSFLVERAYEYDTTPLMPQTVAFMEANVAKDAVIVYDYDRSFNIIWQYYLPENEFVYYEDLDLEDLKGQTFWVINLAGASFSQEEIEEYSLNIEHNPGMGYMGMERFDLWKVTVD